MPKVMLFLLILLLFFAGCKEDGLYLKIKFDQIYGITVEDRVIFENNHIGLVKNVSYEKEGYYLVDVFIEKEFVSVATEHTNFFVIVDPHNKERMGIEMVLTRSGGTPLQNGMTIDGATKFSAFLGKMRDDFSQNFNNLQRQLRLFSEDMKEIPSSKEFKRLEKELKRLLEETKNAGEEAQKRILNEFLPKLQREMEKIREWLKELGREEELKPLEDQMDGFKRI